MVQASPIVRDTNTAPWLEAVAFGVVLCDPALNVLHVNRRCMEMLGITAERMAGSPLFELLEVPARQRVLIMQAIERQQPWQGLSRRGERALKVEIRAAGGIVVASLTDYSADLEQLQRLNDAKNSAEKASEAKSQFLQHMSHELRTPLNAIIGFTQLLKIAPGLDARELDNVAEIENAGTALLALINEILDLSSIEAGKLKLSEAHVHLGELANECLQLVAPIAQPRAIRIDLHVDSDCLLMADHVRLKQVLMNLLSNAIRYNIDGGSVSVHGQCISEKLVRIEIRDSGLGIAPEHLETIFAPFSRLGSIEGSGIGLMITRRLVTLMHGEIGVSSLPGAGSLFWVELPRKCAPAMASLPHRAVAAESAKGTTASGRNEAQSEASRTMRTPVNPGGSKKP